MQDEGLERANAASRNWKAAAAGQPRGFLDNMRAALFGATSGAARCRPCGQAAGSSGVWAPARAARRHRRPATARPPPPAGWLGGPSPIGSGGSFLGTAAASAAGVIGGAMLMNGIRSMFGHSPGSAAYNPGSSTGSPWSGGGGAGSAANSDLARQAGIDDIGTSRSASAPGRDDGSSRTGLLGGDDNDDSGDNNDPTATAYDDSGDDDDTDVAGDFDGDDTDPTA